MPDVTGTSDRSASPAATERPWRWGLLPISIVAVAVVALIGGLATDTGPGSWYQGLEQPSWNPPDAVFGPVWTVLYLAMAVAAWLVARHDLKRAAVRLALAAYAVQLALNLAWTLVFFGAESAIGGVVVIAALLVALVVTALAFARVDHLAAALLLPYLAWVGYAAALTLAIALAN